MMEWLIAVYVAGLAISTTATIIGTLYIWKRVPLRWPAILTASLALRCATSLLFPIVDSDFAARELAALHVALTALLPVFAWMATLELVDRTAKAANRRIPLATIVPTITIVLLYTQRGLVYEALTFNEIFGMRVPDEIRAGIWWPVHGAHGYFLLLLSGTRILGWAARAIERFRTQVLMLAWAILGPLCGHFATLIVLLVNDLTTLDVFSATIFVSVPAWFWLSNRFTSATGTPIARDLLLDRMRDAVAVVDTDGQVIEHNTAFAALVETARDSIVHQALAAVNDGTEPSQVAPLRSEIRYATDGAPRFCDLVTTPLEIPESSVPGGSSIGGYLIVARDVTRQANLVRDLEAYDGLVASDLSERLSRVIQLLERGELADARRCCGSALRSIDTHLHLARHDEADSSPALRLDSANAVARAIDEARSELDRHDLSLDLPSEWVTAMGDPALFAHLWERLLSELSILAREHTTIEVRNARAFDSVRFSLRFHEAASDTAAAPGLLARRIIERLGGAWGIAPSEAGIRTLWFNLPSDEDDSRPCSP